MSLAPVLGNLVAEELTSGIRPALLADYGLERLIGKHADDSRPSRHCTFPPRGNG